MNDKEAAERSASLRTHRATPAKPASRRTIRAATGVLFSIHKFYSVIARYLSAPQSLQFNLKIRSLRTKLVYLL